MTEEFSRALTLAAAGFSVRAMVRDPAKVEDEATNFEFFKRDADCTPAEFRRRHLTGEVMPS